MNVVLLKKIGLAASLAGVVLLGSACTPSDINGQVTCDEDPATGKVTCSYTPGTSTPPTTDTPPPTTDTPPPSTEEPGPSEDPNEGLPAAAMTGTSLDGKARVDWTTERTDVTGWHIERNGTDTSGYGVWGTELAGDVRSFTFDLLRPSTTYRITLVAHTAAGDLAPVTADVMVTGVVTPPTTDTPPPKEDPPPPATGNGDTAAERMGWGSPISSASDEFNYTGAPNSAKWHQAGECWAGHAGNGLRCASASKVANGYLRQTGESNGKSGWVANKLDQRYGKWEARVRSSGTGSGNTYHPLLIIWPQSNQWPEHGEYDFWENKAPNGQCAGHFIHYPHPASSPVQQEGGWCKTPNVNLNEWHNVAIEWTEGYVAGYIDGRQVYKYANGAGPAGRSNIQGMPSGHLTIQLDNFHGSGMQPATYDVDWVRVYR